MGRPCGCHGSLSTGAVGPPGPPWRRAAASARPGGRGSRSVARHHEEPAVAPEALEGVEVDDDGAALAVGILILLALRDLLPDRVVLAGVEARAAGEEEERE